MVIQTLLVVARKYNDILYAISTAEWKKCNEKKLLLISQNIDYDSFPCLKEFDKIEFLNFPSATIKNQLRLYFQLWKLRSFLKCDIFITSNIELISHQYILKLSNCKKAGLLEDGIMNYRTDLYYEGQKKGIIQKILKIEDSVIKNKIFKTYLLKPSLACYYFGDKVVLKFDKETILHNIQFETDLNDKSVFVGQAIYAFDYISLETYCNYVNRIIERYNIDYYIPHAFASKNERINCNTLDITLSKATLEVFALRFNFNLFSLGSSALFSCKLINPQINSFIVDVPELKSINAFEIYEKCGVQKIDLK